jgi:hypothetical protein
VSDEKKQSHKILAVVDALVGLACAGLSAFLVYLTRHPKVVGADDAADATRGLATAAFVFAIPAVLYFVCSFGLFNRWRWAWWISLCLNLTFAAIVCEDVLSDWRHADSEDVWFAAVVAVAAFLHVAQPLWRRMKQRRERMEAEPIATR